MSIRQSIMAMFVKSAQSALLHGKCNFHFMGAEFNCVQLDGVVDTYAVCPANGAGSICNIAMQDNCILQTTIC